MSIASEIARLQQAKADLKTAINAKGQSIDDETLDEYAGFVDAIEVGGGGGTGDYLVRFFDYDGTVLKEEYVDSGEAATAPTSPDRTAEGLTFVEWNNAYSNITSDMDIGATYETTDGKTHIFIALNANTGNDILLYLNKSDGSTLSIDWGDGSAVATFTNSGNFNTGTHTYASAGNYEIELWISSGSGTYGFGNDASGIIQTTAQKYTVYKIYIGEKVDLSKNGSLRELYCLRNVVIPYLGNTFGNSFFSRCYMLEAVVIPNGVTDINTSFLWEAKTVYMVSLPSGLLQIKQNAFESCWGLQKIVIPNSVSFVGSTAFRYCYILEKVIIPTTTPITFYNTTFSYCYNIDLQFTNNIEITGPSVFNRSYRLKNLTIPTATTVIEAFTFQTNYSLKTVTFHSGVTKLKASCFADCSQLHSIYFLNHTSVPTLDNISAFSGVSAMLKIFVPSALEAVWKLATNWSTYEDYIVGV
jgi:hypothetical protein